jgi:hypothetical protein
VGALKSTLFQTPVKRGTPQSTARTWTRAGGCIEKHPFSNPCVNGRVGNPLSRSHAAGRTPYAGAPGVGRDAAPDPSASPFCCCSGRVSGVRVSAALVAGLLGSSCAAGLEQFLSHHAKP